jgi:hypothetical protein
MGKIILEFDSNEEQNDARTALDGWKWKMLVWDLDQQLRSTVKYGQSFDSNKEASSEERDICDRLREQIRGLMNESGLNLDD